MTKSWVLWELDSDRVAWLACDVREGIAGADLLDAGAIFATGFAPFRAGPLHYAKTRGIAAITARLRELEPRHGARFRPDMGWATLPV
jgi:3-hydroxyacyl-CoA dehydrogenase/enoyl-CoA hydratase/3-hydroxybutyryl-CoA epimerase